MRYKIEGGDAFPALRINLDKGQKIFAESNAMLAMSASLTLKGVMKEGFLASIGRKLLGGESFFMQEIAADKNEDGWVLMAAAAPGQIMPVQIEEGRDLLAEKSSFLASEEGVSSSTKVQGVAKGLLSGEGFFIIRLSGRGTAFLSAFGAVQPITLGKDEEIIVDNGHLVAWDADMQYTITKGASTWVSAATSGEGLACKFKGPGRIFIQTRNPKAFGLWATDYIIFPTKN